MSCCSMTGFGRGAAQFAAGTVEVELSSVNRKQFELRCSLPRELGAYEAELRQTVQKAVSRGSVNLHLTVNLQNAGGAGAIHAGRLEELAEVCRQMSEKLGLEKDFRITDLLALPGVMEMPEPDPEEAGLKAAVMQAAEAAVAALQAMRLKEGAALKAELASRLNGLRELLRKIRPLVAGVEAKIRTKLLEKIAEAGLPVDLNDERLLKEILYYADKADVTEELTRLESHFVQFEAFLEKGENAGRNLDFLVQEMFREITTLANKAGTGEVAPFAVAFKSELEKMREQIQNLE